MILFENLDNFVSEKLCIRFRIKKMMKVDIIKPIENLSQRHQLYRHRDRISISQD